MRGTKNIQEYFESMLDKSIETLNRVVAFIPFVQKRYPAASTENGNFWAKNGKQASYTPSRKCNCPYLFIFWPIITKKNQNIWIFRAKAQIFQISPQNWA